jgi:hypothetical protein
MGPCGPAGPADPAAPITDAAERMSTGIDRAGPIQEDGRQASFASEQNLVGTSVGGRHSIVVVIDGNSTFMREFECCAPF